MLKLLMNVHVTCSPPSTFTVAVGGAVVLGDVLKPSSQSIDVRVATQRHQFRMRERELKIDRSPEPLGRR